MPRTWQPHQATQFARQLRLGQTYYYVNTHDTKNNPYEDQHTYSEVVFTDYLPFTKNPCTEYGASAHTLCQTFGPMYDAPPRGMRNLDGPAPQVAGPLGHGEYFGELDEVEIRGLEKHVRSGSDPHTRTGGRTKKRSRFF